MGIPIRVHITLVALLPLFALNLRHLMPRPSLLFGMLAAIGLFASVALHELGHSLVGRLFGYRIRDILLMPIGGVARIENMSRRPRDEILVSLAGPATSILLGLLLGLATYLTGFLRHTNWPTLFLVLAVFNVAVLALFNLIPSFPMDGGRVLRAALSPRLGRLRATRIASGIGRALAMLFFVYSLAHGRWLGMALAGFIYLAARNEWRMVQMEETMKNHPFGPLFGLRPDDVERTDDRTAKSVEVGPPPYGKP